MKILMTGFTARHVGSTRLRYDYLNIPRMLAATLRELGHEVEQRRVTPGEQLRGYDLALVGIIPPNKLVATYQYGALWTLRVMESRALLFPDDWTIVGLRSGLRVVSDQLKASDFRLDRPNKDRAIRLRKQLYRTLDLLAGPNCPWSVLVPLFGWGNIKELLAEVLDANAYTWDPSSLVSPSRSLPRGPGPRLRRWILGSLANHEPWVRNLKLRWPVRYYGNAKLNQHVLPEVVLIEEYANCWGVLAPRYPKVGCGWWRVRYLHAVWARSVLYCDRADAVKIGPSYELPSNVEELTDAKLAEIADRQREELNRTIASRASVLDRLDMITKEVAR